jgi:hypothetical protein
VERWKSLGPLAINRDQQRVLRYAGRSRKILGTVRSGGSGAPAIGRLSVCIAPVQDFTHDLQIRSAGLAPRGSIKVEIDLNENASLYPLVSVELDTLDDDGETVRVTARSYDINEMLGTKMRALMQREQ